ncbi:hypothetical protein C0992_008519 [Termitomyces sp. T32_za158]|nr:hypothetical protein C0992_008519 [Termitomyces sp. T32_za158]
MPYPGCKAPLLYKTPTHVCMEVDQEEEHHKHQVQEVHHKRYYQLGPSQRQAPAQTYARTVAPVMRREVAPQVHSEMGTDVLLQQLEAAGQPVPPTALFLQDNLAIMVMEGLLDQIKLMKRQHISVLEQIDCATKCKLSSLEGVSSEIKRAQPQPAQPVESARPLGAASSQSILAMAPASLSLPAWPTAASTGQPVVVATVAHKPKVPDTPGEEISLDQQDEEMDKVPLTREDLEFMDHFESMAPSAGQKVGPVSRGLAGLAHALNIDFPADIPAWAEFAQLLFMKKVIFLTLPSQLTVVKLTIDSRTPAQYNGLMATEAVDKGKQRSVPAIEDDSDYGQSQSKEEEAKKGKSAAQRFQRMQRNKKLAKKKANRVKAVAAIAHRVQNDFSGCIPDGLEVKVWRPLDVERLNSCFCGALGPCYYYSSLTNTVFVGADTNHVAAFEFSSGQSAKVLGMKVYQFACRGFPGTPYELEWLYKYYSNPHVPCCDRIVTYMLLSELKNFTQHCNVSLHNCTMTLLCSDPTYWDLINPMQGPEDLSFAEKRHIPSRFLHVKDDRATTLHVTRTPHPNVPFDLDQLVQYALIFSRPGMENTWQGIAVDFAYCMHWQTLFGFALCRALCTNSAGKTTPICWIALLMACPGLYCEAIDTFNKVYNELFVAKYGPQLTISQVHVPDDKVRNFLDNDTIHVLLYNHILVEWVDHAYTYRVVYPEQQFHHPMMSLDIF